MIGWRLLMVLGCVSCMCSVNAVWAKASRLMFDTTFISLDTLIEGDSALAVFGFVNAGNDTLRLSDVRSSCGCTAILPQQTTYMPGEKGAIKAIFRSTGFSGPGQKEIMVTSNSSAEQDHQGTAMVKLGISVCVKKEVDFSPSSVYQTALIADSLFSQTAFLINRTGHPIRFVSAVSESKALIEVDAVARPVDIAPGETFPIKLLRSANPENSGKVIHTNIVVTTSRTKYSTHRLRVILHYN